MMSRERALSHLTFPNKDAAQNTKKRPSEGSGSDGNWPPEEKENRKSE